MYKVILHESHDRSRESLTALLQEACKLTLGVDLVTTLSSGEIEPLITPDTPQLLITCLTVSVNGPLDNHDIDLPERLRGINSRLTIIVYTTYKINVPCEYYLLKNHTGHSDTLRKVVGEFLKDNLNPVT